MNDRAPYLRVVFSRRLPNVDVPEQVPGDLRQYGRFGYTNNGEFFMASERTSHPMDTREAGYFGLSRDSKTLFLSPRGASLDFESFATDSLIRRVSEKLGLRNMYRHFKVQDRDGSVARVPGRRASDSAQFASDPFAAATI